MLDMQGFGTYYFNYIKAELAFMQGVFHNVILRGAFYGKLLGFCNRFSGKPGGQRLSVFNLNENGAFFVKGDYVDFTAAFFIFARGNFIALCL